MYYLIYTKGVHNFDVVFGLLLCKGNNLFIKTETQWIDWSLLLGCQTLLPLGAIILVG